MRKTLLSRRRCRCWPPMPARGRSPSRTTTGSSRVQAPAMSPDGRWVAFIRSAIVEAENRRQGELWIVPADGSAPAASRLGSGDERIGAAVEPGWRAAGVLGPPPGRAGFGRWRRIDLVPSRGSAGRRAGADSRRRRDADLQSGQQVDCVHQAHREAEGASVRERRRPTDQRAVQGQGVRVAQLPVRPARVSAGPARSGRDAAGGAVHRPARGWRGEAIDADDGQRERRRVAA